MFAIRRGNSRKQSTALRTTMRRALLLCVYALVAIGSPIGHDVLLGIHLIAKHSGIGSPREWADERVRVTLADIRFAWLAELGVADEMQLAATAEGEAHTHVAGGEHLHPDAADRSTDRGAPDAGSAHALDPVSDDRQVVAVPESRAEVDEGGTSRGEHEHDGFVHSHESDPSSELAVLTADLSKHYVAPATITTAVTLVRETVATDPIRALPEAPSQVLTPPPQLTV